MIRREPILASRAAGRLAALALVTGCEGITNPAVEEEEPGVAEVAVDERCQHVEDALLEAIEARLILDADLTGAHAVASAEEDVTFLAAEVEGGVEAHACVDGEAQ